MVFSVADNHLGSGKDGDLSFVSEMINATQLMWVFLAYSNFGGTLPTSVCNLSTNLEQLWVQGNNLHGSIPKLGNLVNLQSLSMEENSFTGNIPTDIGKLIRLGALFLNSNKLSPSLPSSLGNLTMLTLLHLQRNNLNGTIPLSLGQCQGLLELDLSQNNIDSTIPQQLPIGLPFLSISLNLSKKSFLWFSPIGDRKFEESRCIGCFRQLVIWRTSS
ncbi:putative non-specific serine/threonine protein kinase [Rosa chinensis]|uniref:Putative non-specific serine/threonine protein kinase n=1 Tax=Rosa chinensis TaxID=74649 RepID=A0A2P6SHK6_ROSCH|nr:putative non-specific serine/threonine protein kinase [Rosa chinensis]